MRKIKKLTIMVLSLFTLMTFGVINVSAETIPNTEITIESQNSVIYTGQPVTVFKLSKSSSYSCGGSNKKCLYYLSNSSNKASNVNDLVNSFIEFSGTSTDAKATNVGKYYVHIVQKLNWTDSYNNPQVTYTELGVSSTYAEIKAVYPATVTIGDIPSYTGTKDNVPYYVVGTTTSDITLPFSVTASSNYSSDGAETQTSVDTKWKDATIKLNGSDYSAPATDALTFNTSNGNLTIPSNLASGVYTVTLTAETNNSSYTVAEGSSNTKTITIVKTSDYNIYLDGGNITGGTNSITYGKTKTNIINGINKITAMANNTEYDVWSSSSTITSKGAVKVYKNISSEADEGLLIKGNNPYKVEATITHTYKDTNTFSYTVSDEFNIIEKAVDADVSAISGLIYNGGEQDLVNVSNKNPDNVSLKYKVVKLNGSSTITDNADISKDTYEDISVADGESSDSKVKDAGKYLVYYHVVHDESNNNYKDSYGVVNAQIDKKVVTITGFENKELVYDGKSHENYLEANVVADGYCGTDTYEIKHNELPGSKTSAIAYKTVGKTETFLYVGSNYKLIILGQNADGLYRTLTITPASAKAMTNTGSSTSSVVYYKNNKGTAKLISNGVYTPSDDLSQSLDFRGLEIKVGEQWQTVDASNYTVESGSTIVTLSENYLQSKGDNGKANFEVGKSYQFRMLYGANYQQTEDGGVIFTLKIENYVAPSSSTKSYDAKDKNKDGVISCEEEMNSANWIWSESKQACVYKVINTSAE